MNRAFDVPRVKVCGLSRDDEVQAAVAAGANAVGLVAATQSIRCISMERARELVHPVLVQFVAEEF